MQCQKRPERSPEHAGHMPQIACAAATGSAAGSESAVMPMTEHPLILVMHKIDPYRWNRVQRPALRCHDECVALRCWVPRSLAVAAAGVAVAAAGGCSGVNVSKKPMEPGSPPPVTEAASAFTHGREVQGRYSRGSLWALFYHRQAGQPVKTLWRATGRGDLRLRAVGPAGQIIRPRWGPEPHSASSWQRPGDEWGAGWLVPVPGRWTFIVTRGHGDTTGTLTVQFS